MLKSLLAFINQYQSRFTYRQRFLFFSAIFAIAMPLPTYWMIKTQNFFIQRIEREQVGHKYAASLFELLNKVIRDQILTSLFYYDVATEKSDLYISGRKSITEILNGITELSPEENPTEKSLGHGFSAPSNKIYSPDTVKKLWSQIIGQQAPIDHARNYELHQQLIREIIAELGQLGYSYDLLINLEPLNNAFMEINLKKLPTLERLLGAAFLSHLDAIKNKNSLESTALLLNIIQEENLSLQKNQDEAFSDFKVRMPLEKAELKKGMILQNNYNTYLSEFVQALSAPLDVPVADIKITDLFDKLTRVQEALSLLWRTNNQFAKDVSAVELTSWRVQQNLALIVLLLACIMVACYCVFRVLSISLVNLCNHILEMAKGNFKPCFCSNASDEFGAIGKAFDKMGCSIQEIVGETEKLSKHLAEISSQINKAAKDQEDTVAGQETNIKEIESTAKLIAVDSRELATAMKLLTDLSKTDLSAEEANINLEEMSRKMAGFAEVSEKIGKTFDVIQQKVAETHDIIKFMTKVSDNASLLHLNAAIENAPVERSPHNFNKIRDELKRFSEKTAETVDEIKHVSDSMLVNVVAVRNHGGMCIKDIQQGSRALESIIRQFSSIIKQEREQIKKFETINEVMQVQAFAGENIIELLSHLGRVAEENSESIHVLHQTTTDLTLAAEKLQKVIQSFYKKNEEEYESRT